MYIVKRYIDEILTPTWIRSPFCSLEKQFVQTLNKFLQNYFVVALDILEVLGGNRRVPELRSRSGFDGFILTFHAPLW